MDIKKAIELKGQYQYKLQDASLPELIEADNLSIEALTFANNFFKLFQILFPLPKPGETQGD